MTYLNEFDPFAAEWLRNLYPGATVDERSIEDVRPTDVAGFRRVHFFGGIGGWELALQLAGWPADRPVWTGSCPCQPYSCAGKQQGEADERDLWPEMFRLIRECRPECVFGEQVPNAIGHGWLDRVSADLEGEGYAVGSIVLGAHSVGAPHKRNRLYWCAIRNQHTASDGWNERRTESERQSIAGGCGVDGIVGDDKHSGRERWDQEGNRPDSIVPSGGYAGAVSDTGSPSTRRDPRRRSVDGESGGFEDQRIRQAATELTRCGDADGLGNANGIEFRGEPPTGQQSLDEQNNGAIAGLGNASIVMGGSGSEDPEWGPEGRTLDAWSDCRIVACKDGKFRRTPVISKFLSMVNGISYTMGPSEPVVCSCDGNSTDAIGGIIDDAQKNTGPVQDVQGMREDTDEKEVRKSENIGGLDGVHKTSLLRPQVHGEWNGRNDKEQNCGEQQEAVEKDGGEQLRNMRKKQVVNKIVRASHRLQSDEQCEVELDDVMRELSQAMSFAVLRCDRDAEKALQSLRQAISSKRSMQHALVSAQEAWRSIDDKTQVRAAWYLTFERHPVSAGIPRGMGQGIPELRGLVKSARANRVGRLKGYGNSIVPQVAAVFIRAFMETIGIDKPTSLNVDST